MARAIWMTLSVGVGLALSGCGAADEGADFAGGEVSEISSLGDVSDVVAGDVSEVAVASDGSNVEDAETSELGSLEQALTRGPVGHAGYTCAGLKCSCTGDADCNDMFGDGVCGDVSSCDTSDPLNPKCECLILRVQKPPRQLELPQLPVLVLAR